MNIKNLSLLLWLVTVYFAPPLSAQSTYQAGLLPALNVNKGLKNGWALNAKWESRQLLAQGNSEGMRENQFEYILSDLSLVASKKVGLRNQLAGGYLVRIREGRLAHRILQQFTAVQRYTAFRMAYRLAADQTFEAGQPPTFRLRGRVTLELPLSGQSADPREFYLKINHEYLNAFEADTYDLEVRLVPLLGYPFTDRNKLELGLDYRLRSFLDRSPRTNYWINVNWFLKL